MARKQTETPQKGNSVTLTAFVDYNYIMYVLICSPAIGPTKFLNKDFREAKSTKHSLDRVSR